MPGHPIPSGSVEQAKKDVATLEKLVDEHDVIFLSPLVPKPDCKTTDQCIVNTLP